MECFFLRTVGQTPQSTRNAAPPLELAKATWAAMSRSVRVGSAPPQLDTRRKSSQNQSARPRKLENSGSKGLREPSFNPMYPFDSNGGLRWRRIRRLAQSG